MDLSPRCLRNQKSGWSARTMTSPLENLSGPGGPLHGEPPDADEYVGLVHSAMVRLADAENPANALESRFDLAYNAAHALSLAALRRAGTAPPTAISSFRFCRIRWAWARMYGACYRNATRCETAAST